MVKQLEENAVLRLSSKKKKKKSNTNKYILSTAVKQTKKTSTKNRIMYKIK